MLWGVSETIEFQAIDTGAAGVGKTGDGANFTLRWVKDGTSAALTGSPAITEVDSTNCPGLYKVTLAAADAQCLSGTLHGKSSTSGVQIIPRYFEVLPAAGSSSVLLSDVNTKTGFILASNGLAQVVPAEPTAIPSWGVTSISGLIAWVAALSLNKKTQTSSVGTLRNYADSTNIATKSVSDDTTTLTDGRWT